MIENVELYGDTKIRMKHMCVDTNTPMSKWMIAGARYVLDECIPLVNTPPDDTYTSYTMDISPELKEKILAYVKLNDAKIRDFWVTVSNVVITSPECLE